MTTPTEGDVVLSPKGRKWTVIDVRGEIVQAEEVDTYVVSHFRTDQWRESTRTEARGRILRVWRAT